MVTNTVVQHIPPLQFLGNKPYNPPSLVDGSGTTTAVTVTGAIPGDFAEASFTKDLQGITVTAWVSATGIVSVRFQNETGGTVDLTQGRLRVRVTPATGNRGPQWIRQTCPRLYNCDCIWRMSEQRKVTRGMVAPGGNFLRLIGQVRKQSLRNKRMGISVAAQASFGKANATIRG